MLNNLKILLKLKNKKDKLEDELKKVNRKIEYINEIMAEYFAFNEIKSLKLRKTMFYTSVKIYFSIKNTEKTKKWLRRNGYKSIIKETVPSMSLHRVFEKEINLKDLTPLKKQLPRGLAIDWHIITSVNIRGREKEVK